MPADAEGTLDVNVRHHATLSIKANELEPYALALLADLLRVESHRVKGLQHSGSLLDEGGLACPWPAGDEELLHYRSQRPR